MPKLVLNSAGDQFFLPDSSQFYFDALPGPKKLRYTLNTDHSQAQDLEATILPTLSWLSDVLNAQVWTSIYLESPSGWVHSGSDDDKARGSTLMASNQS